MNGATGAKEMAEIIWKTIIEEPFLEKEVLLPKIVSLIKGFRLKLSSSNYNKIETPSQLAKLTRAHELQKLEKNFWRKEFTAIVGVESIDFYNKKLDEQRLIWNGSNELKEEM